MSNEFNGHRHDGEDYEAWRARLAAVEDALCGQASSSATMVDVVWQRLGAADVLVGGVRSAAEAWEVLQARGLLHPALVESPRRVFMHETETTRETVTGLVGASYLERVHVDSDPAPHPQTILGCAQLALAGEEVLLAEALAHELHARRLRVTGTERARGPLDAAACVGAPRVVWTTCVDSSRLVLRFGHRDVVGPAAAFEGDADGWEVRALFEQLAGLGAWVAEVTETTLALATAARPTRTAHGAHQKLAIYGDGNRLVYAYYNTGTAKRGTRGADALASMFFGGDMYEGIGRKS